MNRNTTSPVMRTTIFAIGLLMSALSYAHGGGHHGGHHGYHGHHGHHGYYGHHGYHGGYYHRGYYNGSYYGAWGGGNSGVGYYAPACGSVRVCNNYGRCWWQRNCY